MVHALYSESCIKPNGVLTVYTEVNERLYTAVIYLYGLRSIACFYRQIGPSSLHATLLSKHTEPSNRNIRKVRKITMFVFTDGMQRN
jgi:hypothetical protein